VKWKLGHGHGHLLHCLRLVELQKKRFTVHVLIYVLWPACALHTTAFCLQDSPLQHAYLQRPWWAAVPLLPDEGTELASWANSAGKPTEVLLSTPYLSISSRNNSAKV
jgi:hypothetical protein